MAHKLYSFSVVITISGVQGVLLIPCKVPMAVNFVTALLHCKLLGVLLSRGLFAGGISYIKAEGMEDHTGGNFKTVEDYVSALDTLEVYPEVRPKLTCTLFV
jgi:hypothetical protein